MTALTSERQIDLNRKFTENFNCFLVILDVFAVKVSEITSVSAAVAVFAQCEAIAVHSFFSFDTFFPLGKKWRPKNKHDEN